MTETNCRKYLCDQNLRNKLSESLMKPEEVLGGTRSDPEVEFVEQGGELYKEV